VLHVKAKKRATDHRLHGAEQDVCDKKDEVTRVLLRKLYKKDSWFILLAKYYLGSQIKYDVDRECDTYDKEANPPRGGWKTGRKDTALKT